MFTGTIQLLEDIDGLYSSSVKEDGRKGKIYYVTSVSGMYRLYDEPNYDGTYCQEFPTKMRRYYDEKKIKIIEK